MKYKYARSTGISSERSYGEILAELNSHEVRSDRSFTGVNRRKRLLSEAHHVLMFSKVQKPASVVPEAPETETRVAGLRTPAVRRSASFLSEIDDVLAFVQQPMRKLVHTGNNLLDTVFHVYTDEMRPNESFEAYIDRTSVEILEQEARIATQQAQRAQADAGH